MRLSNSIAELRQQIHDDLRIQHPDWVELNGECPMCDAYVARLMEELSIAEGTSEAIGGWTHRDPNPAGPENGFVMKAGNVIETHEHKGQFKE
jgi:hypothetical protein